MLKNSLLNISRLLSLSLILAAPSFAMNNLDGDTQRATPFSTLQKRADRGNIDAQCDIATKYFFGQGVKKDLDQAFEYWVLAADQGHIKARYNVGLMYEKGIGVHQDNKQAFMHFKLAADQGYKRSQYNVGCRYYNDKSYKKAFSYLKQAADQKHREAQYAVGLLYLNGTGIEKNKDQALEYFQLAAGQGHEVAQCFVENSGTVW